MHMLIYNDPSGEAYRKLIDDRVTRTATFSLKGPRIRKFPEPDEPPLPEWPLLAICWKMRIRLY
ncbi:hypothetical protein [Saccharibacillus sacchari]|uniref:Uncharacterized protein n=1 Tax=Saccharibacillus sacchari TaxID=456493 RepID=A0ACC6P7X4_9BACL